MLEANPKVEQFWLSYIDALIKQKQFETAQQALDQLKKQGLAGEKSIVLEAQLASVNKQENVSHSSPSPQQISNLSERYQSGRFADAEKLAVSMTQKFPEYPLAGKC